MLRVYVASDAFLHTWDERFHALVAKNLTKHFLKPTLYDEVVFPYDIENWVANHVWLEKGPVPLICLALSMKVLGVNLFALRLPSVILSLLSVYLTFLIAQMLFNKRIALMAAFFHSINGLIIELAGGRISSDHVETFFIFFVELGIYFSILSYHHKRKFLLSVFIGLCTGCAVLSKWLPGLLVPLFWFIGSLMSEHKKLKKILLQMLIISVSFLFLVLPYYLYIFRNFPEESSWVFKKFIFAFSDTVEGHQAPAYYYLHKMGVVFGELIYVPVLLSFYSIIRRKPNRNVILITLWWLTPLVIFSFAETKRATYLLITAPAFFILLAFYLDKFQKKISKFKHRTLYIILVILLAGLPIRYSIERTKVFAVRDRNPMWSQELRQIDNKLNCNDKCLGF
ncbi:MAG: glycosyltransferase family 39 protein [Bacteroidota bacterium]|nr:glycosyltransferase family 39 protein [Bacteroidota bacterium]